MNRAQAERIIREHEDCMRDECPDPDEFAAALKRLEQD